MIMIPALFDGKTPEKAKMHYERFKQYITFQTKEGNICDTTKEAIELFEHTLDKKVLILFQQHNAEFKDLTTLKIMFLARYNPWGKTKRDQLQSWNNLSFDPQKIDIDEQIDLVSTLDNMLGQDKQAKMEKFIETMPMIIQTHLIIERNWKMLIKKAKDLEHIIHKCEAPAIAASSLQGAGEVSGLYSHTAQSQDQDADNIPKPFKSTKCRGGKKSGKGKQKSQQQPQPPPPPLKKRNNIKRQIIIITMKVIEAMIEAADPIGANKVVVENLIKVSNKGEGPSKIIIGDNIKANHGQYNTSHGGYYNNNNYGNYQGRGGHGHGGNDYRGHGHGQGSY